jgi:hypothetical protein
MNVHGPSDPELSCVSRNAIHIAVAANIEPRRWMAFMDHRECLEQIVNPLLPGQPAEKQDARMFVC